MQQINFVLTHKNQKWYFLMIRHFFGVVVVAKLFLTLFLLRTSTYGLFTDSTWESCFLCRSIVFMLCEIRSIEVFAVFVVGNFDEWLWKRFFCNTLLIGIFAPTRNLIQILICISMYVWVCQSSPFVVHSFIDFNTSENSYNTKQGKILFNQTKGWQCQRIKSYTQICIYRKNSCEFHAIFEVY